MSDVKDIIPQSSYKNERFEADLRKAEKLVSALYLITSFIGEKEPLKWKLRTLGSKLIDAEQKMHTGYTVDHLSQRTAESTIDNIVSYLRISRDSGLISEMNERIIEKELENHKQSLHDEKDAYLREELSKATAIQPVERPTLEKPNVEISYKRQLLNQETERPKGHKEGLVFAKKTNRQNVIIELIKKRKEIMIKDVTPLIDGCSEKTIQRELLSMVKRGMLRKAGEKRWSRYSLV